MAGEAPQWRIVVGLVALVGLVAPASAVVQTHQTDGPVAHAPTLDSREYQLMLEPHHFNGSDPRGEVARLARMIEALVADHVTGRAAVDFSSSAFELDEKRAVRFWDTAACDLERSGLALRERADLEAQDASANVRELTLKFRSADLFLAAQTPLPAMPPAKDPEHKFEEDVTPLAVHTAGGKAVVADPPSTRSHYSRSTTQEVVGTDLPDTLRAAGELFPTLTATLLAGGSDADTSAVLVPGQKFTERVYQSPEFGLGDGTKTSYSLTLWYERPGSLRRPALAEISFKYDTSAGSVTRKVAQRASDLYLATSRLPWGDPGAPTKTALVSPAACPG